MNFLCIFQIANPGRKKSLKTGYADLIPGLNALNMEKLARSVLTDNRWQK
jgi:hypothetical protein